MWKRMTAIWLLVRSDARRLWFALRHPDSPAWLKAGTALLLLYLLSPIDLVPGIIPLLGQLDDLFVMLGALRFTLNHIDPAIAAISVILILVTATVLVLRRLRWPGSRAESGNG